jgi:hypothetical protein
VYKGGEMKEGLGGEKREEEKKKQNPVGRPARGSMVR